MDAQDEELDDEKLDELARKANAEEERRRRISTWLFILTVVILAALKYMSWRQENPPKPPEPPRVDLNSASQAELEALHGIGPSLAKRIIEGRPYRTYDDVLNVRGVGPAMLEKIGDQVEIRPP
jgi:hypothetical protein